MGRPRKNAVKTQDTLLPLQEVPEIPLEEQPYPLPKGWKWVYASYMFDIIYGKGLPTKNLLEDGYPVFGANGEIGYYSKYMYSEPKALMSCRGAYSGTMNLSLPFSYITNNSLIIEDKYHKFSPKFIFLLFSSLDKKSLITGSAQPQVTIQSFNRYPVPLPPENIADRIVDNIESLFAKLDEAKEQAEAVLDGFETRKSAILHKAFSGELTEKWRREKEGKKTAWRTMKFNQVAEIKSNLVDPSDFPNFPHIAPDNIEKKSGRLLEYRTISEDNVISGKHRFYPGYILYSKIRPYLSKVVIIDFEGLCSADMYPIKAKENTKFLWYYMLSGEFVEQASSAGSRSVLPKINQKELSRIIVHWPTPTEQQEIVRILDTLLAKEQQAKDAAEIVLEQIELMKKSILARAFRGELRGRH